MILKRTCLWQAIFWECRANPNMILFVFSVVPSFSASLFFSLPPPNGKNVLFQYELYYIMYLFSLSCFFFGRNFLFCFSLKLFGRLKYYFIIIQYNLYIKYKTKPFLENGFPCCVSVPAIFPFPKLAFSLSSPPPTDAAKPESTNQRARKSTLLKEPPLLPKMPEKHFKYILYEPYNRNHII